MADELATKADLERLGREADEEIRRLNMRLVALTERVLTLELWAASRPSAGSPPPPSDTKQPG